MPTASFTGLPAQATPAADAQARQALTLLSDLQQHWVSGLQQLGEKTLQQHAWLRSAGRCGGGQRYQAADSPLFNRVALNLSQVQYEADPERPLASATALSCILHPQHPHWPSLHMHISWTAPKNSLGSWRLMADLNPALPDAADQQRFSQALQTLAPTHWAQAFAEGERYFYIPALQRHRGVSHFYLECLQAPDPLAEPAAVKAFGQGVIDTYLGLLQAKQAVQLPISPADQAAQLDYHSLYFFQVLTLDRGTSSGVLVHSDNDSGILGSLPGAVDKNLLRSWLPQMPAPQDQLLNSLLEVLPDETPSSVSEALKPALAERLRAHYRQHPDALALQARGSVLPPTIQNHQRRRAAEPS
ncbi:MAG: coproporphyrinogen III oxidase [Candidatus Sericytochromatia bacterium]|nr:coproporphyrinogen III oxidase [Candidatus Sericytochromatia bacterium]